MKARRRLVVVVGLLLVIGAVVVYALPGIVRHLTVSRIEAMTGRDASIDAVDVSLLRGRVAVHGFKLAERDGSPLAELARLDLHLSLWSLLSSHLRIHELVLDGSNVRIVRLPDGRLNVADLLRTTESKEKGGDITIGRFRVTGGRVTLEDRALAEPRTWTSEQMTVDAQNLSTVRSDGTAVATSITAGAPVRIEVKDLRLYPIHLHATATVQGLDLTPARVYLPADTRFDIDRGRMTTTVTVLLDAEQGIRADATGSLDDVVLVEPRRRDVLARMPKLTTRLSGFGLRNDGAMQVTAFTVDGTMSVRDPTARAGAPLKTSSVRGAVNDFTWPATSPGRVDFRASIPGGGALALVGTVRPPPAATELALRVTDLNLAHWAQFVPGTARVTGVAAADLRMNEPFAAGIPARVQGTASVRDLTVADARQSLVRAQRVEAGGLEVEWPKRVGV